MTLKDVYDLFDLLELYFSGHPGLSVKNIRPAYFGKKLCGLYLQPHGQKYPFH